MVPWARLVKELYRTEVMQCGLSGFYNDKEFEVPNMAWPGISKRELPSFLQLAQKERIFWILASFGSNPNEMDHTSDPKCPSLTYLPLIPKYGKNIFCEQVATACFKCHVHMSTLKKLWTHFNFRPGQKNNSLFQWTADGNILQRLPLYQFSLSDIVKIFSLM